jgi:hypothetical protein
VGFYTLITAGTPRKSGFPLPEILPPADMLK